MSVIETNNFKIGYIDAGKAINNRLPLIFLHGVGSDKSVWQRQIDYFSQKMRVAAFDYPGYGESDLSPKDLTREEIARYLIEAMDELKIDKAHFCGLSMGGVIALEIYRQAPERVMSLILANTFAKHPEGALILERSLKFIEAHSMREFADQRVDFLLAAQTNDEVRREVGETMARINKQTYRWSSRAVWTADYLFFLPQIKAPTLVIGADFDAPTPPALSAELAGKIPNARLEIIQNAGHLSNLDQPQIFNQLVEKFVD